MHSENHMKINMDKARVLIYDLHELDGHEHIHIVRNCENRFLVRFEVEGHKMSCIDAIDRSGEFAETLRVIQRKREGFLIELFINGNL